MRAMILAAGLGTRLRPLTHDRPKALVEIAGRTLLEITIARLRAAGVRELILNVHHFDDMISRYLEAHQNFGMRISVSHEEILLETGGGLKNAAWFFLDDPARLDEPFILHNVDVISTIDLPRMVQFHADRHALATLAVQWRQSSRQLLFDRTGQLCGRRAGAGQEPEIVCSASPFEELAFCGIHVISPRLLTQLSENGPFSIITSYLRLAAEGQTVSSFRADDYYWRDLGRKEDLLQAEQDLKLGVLPV